MSLYAEYLRELTDREIIETDRGFATYRFIPESNSVYIIDIYVKPEFRKTGEASSLADSIKEIAKKRGCTEMLGSVIPSNNGSTRSIQVLLGYGMSVKSSANDFIVFAKGI